MTTDAHSPHAAADCVIFDMDGTITVPLLDFAAFRASLDLGPGPILEQLPEMPVARQDAVLRALYNFEMEAAVHSTLQPRAAETIHAIRAAGIPTVLMTRNCRAALDIVLLKHALEFDLLRTREDGAVKPLPDPILETCALFDADPARTWVIGDFHYDIIAGRAAGAITVLLLNGDTPPPFAAEADHCIRRLDELPPIMGLSAR